MIKTANSVTFSRFARLGAQGLTPGRESPAPAPFRSVLVPFSRWLRHSSCFQVKTSWKQSIIKHDAVFSAAYNAVGLFIDSIHTHNTGYTTQHSLSH
ncbi:hypothetical protein RIF29_01942 [Crotalaria pallida]|uniref:Uncharacterized protein n=1 Tax=Crotalaria pallida TaxID=3830 RepID=A0AAN9P8C2_CROPI